MWVSRMSQRDRVGRGGDDREAWVVGGARRREGEQTV